MLARSPPVKINTLPLYTVEDRPTLLPGYVWAHQTVKHLVYSPNGQYLAVAVEHNQSHPEYQESDSESDKSDDFDTPASLYSAEVHEVCTYEVYLYEASAGYKQCARFDSQVREPVIYWSPASCLCVAQLLAKGTRGRYALDAGWSTDMSMKTAAFIYNPDFGAAHNADEGPCLTDYATIHLSSLGKRCQVRSCWSPSGQYLLVYGVELPKFGMCGDAGWLAIADVERGSLVAQSKLKVLRTLDAEGLSFVWHPILQAFICGGNVGIHDMAAIRMAGFGIGTLPEKLCVNHAGFSADASLLVAEAAVLGHDCLRFYHLECKLAGLQICLGQPQVTASAENHEEIFIVGWLPGANTVLMQSDTSDATVPVLL